ncbi:unnamed protein product [Adineta ricciae]|uniref:Uncharacterized protein n=1 Tax=Adineta ricciae TaxID=249248 RepID=A0A815JR54_ADIRI|nr:unnamed protein product [Adineta ricciae]
MSSTTNQSSRCELPVADQHLETVLDSLNHLIDQSHQQIIDEQQSMSDVEQKKLDQMQVLQSEIQQIENQIASLHNETEQLTLETCSMVVRQNETALIRHNKLLKGTIEHINHILSKRSIVNDPLFDQLRKDLTSQQEKLFFIRNQLDIDHNQLTTNVSLLKECQEQRKQLEQIMLEKQSDLQSIQKNQDDYVQKQLKLQKLQFLIQQHTRIRNEIQQLEGYIEPKRASPLENNRRQQDIQRNKTHFREVVDDSDEEIINASKVQQFHTKSRTFARLKDHPDK